MGVLTRQISAGSGTVVLSQKAIQNEHVAIQVISDSNLDQVITISLIQSNQIDFVDGEHDLPETPITANAGANSNLLTTRSFYCDFLALKIDVLTATLGTLTIITNYKD